MLFFSPLASVPLSGLVAAGNQAGNAEITGTIEAAGNQPVDNIELRAENSSAGVVATGTPNRTGEFALSVEPNLTYGVTFDQDQSGYPIDDVPDGGVIGRFPVGDESVDVGTQTLDTPHRLNVTVVDDSGTPVEDAIVTLILSEGDEFTTVRNTSGTNSAGEFILGQSPGAEVNGTVGIRVDPPSDNFTTNRTNIDVTSDRDVRIVLERRVEVSGILENPDGSAVTTGEVGLFNESTGTFNTSALNASGGFSVTTKPNLTYESGLSQRPAGYPLDGVVDVAPGRLLEVGTTDVDLGTNTLPAAHRLNVTVVNESGAPVEGAGVTVVKTNEISGIDAIVSNETGPAGEFVLGGTIGTETNGTVDVSVEPPADSSLRPNETTVEVTRDRDVRIVLERRVEVSGVLENPNGSAVTTGGVTLRNASTGTFNASALNASGGFSITTKPNLTYETRFDQRSAEYPIDGVVDFEPGRLLEVGTTDVDLGTRTLPAAHRLNITVVNESGAPVEGAEVFVGKTNETSGTDAFVFNETGPAGEFALGGTVGTETNGTVNVSVGPPDGSSLLRNATTVEVTGDRDVRIVLEEEVSITGGVKDANGTSVSGLNIEARNDTADIFETNTTTASGDFRVPVEPNLTYGLAYDQFRSGYPLDGVPDFGILGEQRVGDAPVDLGTETLPDAHRLNVTVVNESGAPVEGAQVDISKAPEGIEAFAGVFNETNAAGQFVVGGTVGTEVNGTIEVDVDPPAGSLLFENATTIEVTQDRNVQIVLEEAVALSGRINDANGTSVSGLNIEARNDTADFFTQNTTTGSGALRLLVEPNLTYGLDYYQKPNDYPLDGVPDFGILGEQRVGAESVDVGTETLSQAHRLNITVVNESNAPVEGAQVFVNKDAEDLDVFGGAGIDNATNAAGQFVVGGTVGTETNGTVDVSVEPPADSSLLPNETTVEVTGDRDVRIVLERGATVTGRLESSDGVPLSGDLVAFHDEQKIVNASLTNETGTFSASVPANETSIVTFVDWNRSTNTAFPRNGIPDLYVLDETTPRNDTNIGNITVPSGDVVDVRVENTAGDPIPNATIRMFSPQVGGRLLIPGAARTDDEGLLRFRSESGIELTGEIGLRVNLTTAEGTFQRATVDRNLTVTNDTTVTVTATRVLVVDPDDPAAYDTIQAAVEDAPAGSVIRVRPGTYEGTVRIDKPLTLRGRPGDAAPGPATDPPVLTGHGRTVSGIIIGDNVSDVTIAGFEIRNYSFHDGQGGRGITAHGTGHANVLVRDTHVHDIGWTAIVEATRGTTVRNWTVTRNVLEDFATFGIRLANVEQATVTNNTVTGTDGWTPWNNRTTSDVGILIEAKLRNGTAATTSSIRVADNEVGGELRAGISVNAWNTLSTGTSRLRDVAVHNNTVTDETVTFGIGMGAMGHDAALRNGSIRDNTVATSESGIGIWTLANASATAVQIRSNRVTNTSRGLTVLRTTTTGTVRVMENRFIDNRIGVAIAANGSAANTTVTENAIADNTRYGVANNGTGTLNATYNWWGASDGPSGAFAGSGDAVRGNATVRPFYLDAERTQLSEPANVTVSIDATNAPVTEGQVLEITATVENTGDVTGTRTVVFTTGETRRDATEVTLAPGERREVDLSWTTTDGDSGEYTATVSTGDDAASTTVSVDAFVPEPEPTTDITLDATAPATVAGGANATLTYTVENTGDTTLDSLTLDPEADTTGLRIVTDGPIQFEAVRPGETVRANITVRGEATALGEQRVTATATAESDTGTVTATTSTAIVVTQSVRVEAVGLTPSRVVENRTVTRTVPFRISKISDDGDADTITVRFPATIGNLTLDRVSIRDAAGEDVTTTAVTATDSTVRVEVSPDGDAGVRTLSGRLTVTLTTPTVATNTTGNITLTVSDSVTGRDSALTAFEILDRNASDAPPSIGASDAPPTDPDGDGLYEDINGDGDVTPGDASVLFNAWFERGAGVTNNTARFDFNGDGEFVVGDMTVLFREALGLDSGQNAAA